LKEIRVAFKILVGKPNGRQLLEDLGVDGRIVLKLFLKNSLKIAKL
jgi:hypothetical protein